MQLLISGILTLVLGAGAFLGLSHNPNNLIANANEKHKAIVEISPTATPTISPTASPISSPTVSPSASPKDNGLHLGIIRGRHLGENKKDDGMTEDENENEMEENHERERERAKPSVSPTPTASPVNQVSSITRLDD